MPKFWSTTRAEAAASEGTASDSPWGRPFAVFLLLSLIAVVGVAWWSAPRGFDFLDSGCYFLEYAFPHDSADTHTSYRFFASPFYYLLGESIVAFRWLSWLAVWGAMGVFAWGWLRHVRVLAPGFPAGGAAWAIYVAFLHSSSAMYTIKPAALTYNSLNLVGVCVACGLFFAGTANLMKDPVTAARRGLWQIAAGALVASIDFFIKPTTAAFVLGGFLAYLIFSPALTRELKKRLLWVALVATGVGGLVLLVLVGGWGAFVTRFSTLVGILRNDSYMSVLLERTVREFVELYQFLRADLAWSLPALILFAALLFFLRRSPQQRLVAAGAGGVILGLWLYRLWQAKLWRGSHQLYFEGVVARFYLSALVLTGVAALLSAWLRRDAPSENSSRSSWVLWSLLIFFLIATPFAGAFGSTTTVYLNGALYAGCWLGVILLSLHRLARDWQAPLVWPAVLVPLIGFSVAQLVHGQIVMPYMNPKPLWEQTHETRMGVRGVPVLLDLPTHLFVEDTRKILTEHGFKPGDDIFCFFNIPGLVYAVGGRSPVIPWYFGRIYVDDRVEEWHLQKAGEDRRNKAWVITQADAPRFKESYLRGGMNFPDGYDRIGTLINPATQMEVGLWKRRVP